MGSGERILIKDGIYTFQIFIVMSGRMFFRSMPRARTPNEEGASLNKVLALGNASTSSTREELFKTESQSCQRTDLAISSELSTHARNPR